jgi:hypothetical protein
MPNKGLFDKGPVASTSTGNKPVEAEKPIPSTLKDYAADQVADAEGFKEPQKEEKTTKVNLDDLNETTLLKYPIVAKTLNDSPMAIIKPKDSSLVFHWVFYDRSATGNTAKVSAANVQRYKFWGFEFATLDDIEGGEESLGEGMIDDGANIINYDTVLMKINKIRLMGHYKKNLLDSLMMTDAALVKAIKSAENDVLQSGMYGQAMAKHPQAKIEFFSPGIDSK